MADGLSVELNELISLRRLVRRVNYKPEYSAAHSGAHLSKLRGRGMDFAEVRNYQAGDEIRHMEWRVTARTGRPHVKIYQEERELPTVILSDFNPSMFFGTRIAYKSVIAARLAALITWTVVNQGDRVGGLVFSASEHNEFIPRSRDMGALPLLASLSQYTHQDAKPYAKAQPLSEILIRLRRVTRPGSILVLISDFYNLDADCERHLSRLRAHSNILAYHICDPLELAPPPPQHYAVTNGHQEVLVDITNKTVTKAYQNFCDQRIKDLETLFKRLKMQYVQVTAHDDLSRLVHQTFPRRSRV
ncbi:MAG: DUF58 domain-containing protein [Tatlockia sp.]|nr:DUF58 domain-containing protein [Tatlockia sp.]